MKLLSAVLLCATAWGGPTIPCAAHDDGFPFDPGTFIAETTDAGVVLKPCAPAKPEAVLFGPAPGAFSALSTRIDSLVEVIAGLERAIKALRNALPPSFCPECHKAGLSSFTTQTRGTFPDTYEYFRCSRGHTWTVPW